MDHAGQNARFLPVVVFVAGRHEDELSPEIPQRRFGQALDERAALMTRAALVYGQQVDGRTKTRFDSVTSRGLDDLGCHAGPGRGAALHDVGWRNLDVRIEHVGRGAMVRLASLTAIGAPVTSRPLAPLDRKLYARLRQSRRTHLEE